MRIGFEAIVDEGGLPVNVRITQSSGSEYLDNEILRESAGWRFHPALIDGHPIRALYRNDGQSPRM
ncbi:MAG TPA: TonB family protein [Gemmatimonadales bacterium]|jgi:TonB family protein